MSLGFCTTLVSVPEVADLILFLLGFWGFWEGICLACDGLAENSSRVHEKWRFQKP